MEKKTINLFKKIVKLAAPPKEISVSDWAEENIIITDSSIPGKYSTRSYPYQKEIMNAFNDPKVEKIVCMTSSQIGKNVIVNNIIGYLIDVDPCPILFIEPTEDLAKDYSKRRIAPLIRETKCLAEKVSEEKSRDSNNTILTKIFPGGMLTLVGANVPRKLASKPIRVVIADEVDGFESSSGDEGDPIDLAEKRTTNYWNRKFLFVSTPLYEETSRIYKEYLQGTQEVWKKECPHCGEFVYINLDGMEYQHTVDKFGNHFIKNVTFMCPACLEKFDEFTWKSTKGQWIANNPNAEKTRSFHLNVFVAPLVRWEDIIAEYEKSKNNSDKLKVFVNTRLGLPYKEKGEIENEDDLLSRREVYEADLPDGVLILTAGVDVQDDRLEYEIVGWGKEEQSWGIEYGVIMGSPEQSKTWNDLYDKLDTVFKFKNGVGLKVACTCVDSGGHYTTEVYQFCKKHENRRIFAVKGQGGPGIPLIHRLYRSKKENAAVFILGVDSGKSSIMSRLKVKKPEDGEGYCHFPSDETKGYTRTYFKGLISEKLVVKRTKKGVQMVWEKINSSGRNEPLDVRNYAQAALYILKPNFDVLEKRLKSIKISEEAEQKAQPKTLPRRRGVVKRGIQI